MIFFSMSKTNLKPKNWRKVKLGEVTALITKGTTPTTIGGNFTDKGINFIKVESITEEGRFFPNKFDYINENTNSLLKRSIIEENDILYSIAGSIGRIAFVTKNELPANTNQALAIIRLNTEKAYPKYLFYALSTHLQRTLANNLVALSVQANINLKQVSEFEVLLPDLNEQKRIAKTLSAFDDKIELNNKINQALEQIAQAIFKEWFVLPCKASVYGGKLPEGWKMRKITEIIKRLPVGKKYDNKNALAKGKIPILDQGQSGFIGFHNGEPGVKATIKNPVIVFTNHTCYYRLLTQNFSCIQNVLPYIGNNSYPTLFIYFLTKGKIKMQEYKGHWPEFEEQVFAIPPIDLAEKFSDSIQSLIKKIVINENENKKLLSLRNLLLPKLMSGKIRVKL